MCVEINWLLLSDLHIGLDKDNWLWPNVKNQVYEDIKKLEEQIGAFDLVFFTGDMTQKASVDEYNLLNDELLELWSHFSNTKQPPLLCPVPGNHDLVRPKSGTALVNALTKYWWDEE